MKLPPTSFWHISWRYQEANGCSDGLWTPASVTLALIPAMISRWALWKLPVQDIILWGLFIDVYLEPCKNRILNLMPSCLSDYLWIHLYLGHDFGCCVVITCVIYSQFKGMVFIKPDSGCFLFILLFFFLYILPCQIVYTFALIN